MRWWGQEERGCREYIQLVMTPPSGEPLKSNSMSMYFPCQERPNRILSLLPLAMHVPACPPIHPPVFPATSPSTHYSQSERSCCCEWSWHCQRLKRMKREGVEVAEGKWGLRSLGCLGALEWGQAPHPPAQGWTEAAAPSPSSPAPLCRRRPPRKTSPACWPLHGRKPTCESPPPIQPCLTSVHTSHPSEGEEWETSRFGVGGWSGLGLPRKESR